MPPQRKSPLLTTPGSTYLIPWPCDWLSRLSLALYTKPSTPAPLRRDILLPAHHPLRLERTPASLYGSFHFYRISISEWALVLQYVLVCVFRGPSMLRWNSDSKPTFWTFITVCSKWRFLFSLCFFSRSLPPSKKLPWPTKTLKSCFELQTCILFILRIPPQVSPPSWRDNMRHGSILVCHLKHPDKEEANRGSVGPQI